MTMKSLGPFPSRSWLALRYHPGVATDRAQTEFPGLGLAETPGDARFSAESPWHLALGFAAVLLVALAHAVHDAGTGTRWHHTVPPLVVMLLQMVVLTFGYRALRARRVRAVALWAAATSVCALFGTLWLLLHTDLSLDVGHALRHGLPAGLGFGAFWALLFRLPALVRDANLRRLAADSALRQAELAQLRSSLQPHFLLNTLHAIAALTVDEPLVARRLLASLGELLRDALESSPELRPLSTDLAWLRRYAEILEIRHGGAVRFEWDVAPEAAALCLPKLLLQPLVENAVKHGALRRAEGGVVALGARCTATALELVVADNGPGMAPGAPDGLGLRIVRDRLRLAHPGATLAIDSSSEGTRAVLAIPRLPEVQA
jgi:signal transduction histidine kinase